MSSPKYIGNYDDFIAKKLNEQEEVAADADAAGGADPFAAPADNPPPAQTGPTVQTYQFIFIDEGKKKQKFPGGGYLKAYKSYEIKSDDLEKWAKRHIENEQKRDDFVEIVSGKKFNLTDEERAIMRDFRKHVAVGHIGRKSTDIEVEFDEDDTPMTDDLEITFIDTKKE